MPSSFFFSFLGGVGGGGRLISVAFVYRGFKRWKKRWCFFFPHDDLHAREVSVFHGVRGGGGGRLPVQKTGCDGFWFGEIGWAIAAAPSAPRAWLFLLRRSHADLGLGLSSLKSPWLSLLGVRCRRALRTTSKD